MTLAELARTDVVTAEPDATISELAFAMANENVGSVVVTEGDAVVGIVTDRDIALDVLGTGADPQAWTARDVMSADPLVADVGAGVMETVREMYEFSVRRVPVVDDGSLYGIITMDDLLVLLANELSNLAGVVEAESPPYA